MKIGPSKRPRRRRAPMWSPRRPSRPGSRWRPSFDLGRLGRAGKWLAWGLAGIVAAGAAGWGGVRLYQDAQPVLHDWLEIREVTVSGLQHLTRDEIVARLALRGDETQWTVKPGELEDRLLTHPWIKSAAVARAPFHALTVAIAERRPAAVLKSPSVALLLDGEGQVLSALPDNLMPDLPVLVGVDPDHVMQGEDRSRQLVQNGIRLAGLLDDEFDGVMEIDLGNPDNAVAYVHGLRFQFGPASFEEKWQRYRKISTHCEDYPLVAGGPEGRPANPGSGCPALQASAGEDPALHKQEIDLRYPGKVIVRERG